MIKKRRFKASFNQVDEDMDIRVIYSSYNDRKSAIAELNVYKNK